MLTQFFGYLRRDPNSGPDTDYTGYEFWLAKLNQFNGNFVNAEMVKAFITSTEYRHRFGRETELGVILSLHTKISSFIQQSGIIEPLSVPDRHLTAKDW